MILYFSGGSNPVVESNSKRPTLMLSFYTHVKDRINPTKRLANVLKMRKHTKGVKRVPKKSKK